MNEPQPPPSLILGTMTFGGQVNEQNAGRMVAMFFDAGHSRLDTAHVYTDGKTEEILGRILKPYGRDRYAIDSKAHPGDGGGLDPQRLTGQLETSLDRLGTDHVDIFYLHAPDPKTPLAATLAACHTLYRQGKFRELGLSNYPSWQVAEIRHLCHANGWVLPTVYQGMYNAVTRSVEEELMPALAHYGMKFFAFNPLAGGLLTGKYPSRTETPESGRFVVMVFYRDRYWHPPYFSALEHIREVAAGHGTPMAEAALRWVCHDGALAAANGDGIILGASNTDQLASNLDACRQGANPAAVAAAFAAAWAIARPDCPRYFKT